MKEWTDSGGREEDASSCSQGPAAAAAAAPDPQVSDAMGCADKPTGRRVSSSSIASSSSSEDVYVTRNSASQGRTPVDCGSLVDQYEISSGLRAALLVGGPPRLGPPRLFEEQQPDFQQGDFACSSTPPALEELSLLRLERAPSLSLAVGSSSADEADSKRSSLYKTVSRARDPSSLRRCSSSGAVPDHVSGSRHMKCGFEGAARGVGSPRAPRFGRYFSGSPRDSSFSGFPCNSRPTLSSSSSKCSSSSSSMKNALAWSQERRFSFAGVTTRSLWNTRICACRPSPIVAANRCCDSSRSSALTLASDPSASREPQAAAAEQPAVAPAGRSNSSSSSSSNSSSSRSSSRCSMWEGSIQHQQQHKQQQDKETGIGEEVLDYDDPLLRLQSMQLQQQPQSPLLLLRFCSQQESDMLQQLGGDTCPVSLELPPSVKDAVSEQSAASGPPQIPASAASCYGFTWASEVTASVRAYEKKTASQKKKQAKQWEAYLASNPSLEDRKALKKLVRKGIPDHLRGKLWASFLGADELLDSDPEAFERLQQEELPRDVSGQIELDLPRTFPNNKRFRCSSGICALRRVLRGFAAARPAVGYCQGLNFVAATLLLFQRQELALASLLQLVTSRDKDKGLQIGRYYSSGMSDLRRDMKVLELLIRQKSPRVFEVLRKTGVEVEWLAAEWFLCLFCTACPEPTVLRIWDCLMLEGPKILFRVALGIIFFFESQLAKMQLLEQVMGSLKGKLALLVEHNELLHICFHKLRSFSRRKLQQLQQTVAAGLVDPCRSTQQQFQQEQEQETRQTSRRRRLVSFGRLSRQQSACEVAPQPAPQKPSKWRQKLSKVNLGVRRRSTLNSSAQQGDASSLNPESHNTSQKNRSERIAAGSKGRIRSVETPRAFSVQASGHPQQQQQQAAS